MYFLPAANPPPPIGPAIATSQVIDRQERRATTAHRVLEPTLQYIETRAWRAWAWHSFWGVIAPLAGCGLESHRSPSRTPGGSLRALENAKCASLAQRGCQKEWGRAARRRCQVLACLPTARQ